MKPLFVLRANGVTVTNWDDLQVACAHTDTALQTFLCANRDVHIVLTRSNVAGEDRNRVLIDMHVDPNAGGYHSHVMNVEFRDGVYREVAPNYLILDGIGVCSVFLKQDVSAE